MASSKDKKKNALLTVVKVNVTDSASSKSPKSPKTLQKKSITNNASTEEKKIKVKKSKTNKKAKNTDPKNATMKKTSPKEITNGPKQRPKIQSPNISKLFQNFYDYDIVRQQIAEVCKKNEIAKMERLKSKERKVKAEIKASSSANHQNCDCKNAKMTSSKNQKVKKVDSTTPNALAFAMKVLTNK